MVISRQLEFECRLIKRVIYKVKNQLGKTIQFRRLQNVYKSLKVYMSGGSVQDFQGILEKAAISALDFLMRKFLVPVFSVILGIYSRINYVVMTTESPKCRIMSRKLKKAIRIKKNMRNCQNIGEKMKFKSIEKLLESIRKKV